MIMSKALGKVALLASVLALNLAAATLDAGSTQNDATLSTPTEAPAEEPASNVTGHANDTASPNEPIEKPDCDASVNVSIRYSATSARLYLESEDGITRGGCVTLEDIWVAREGKAPLYAVNNVTGDVSDNATGTWLLEEELYVEDGITLKVSRYAEHISEFVLVLQQQPVLLYSCTGTRVLQVLVLYSVRTAVQCRTYF